MKRRTLYYWSKLYTSQLSKGEPYSQLRKTVAINILDFNYLKFTKEYHNYFLLKEKNSNQLLTDKNGLVPIFLFLMIELRIYPSGFHKENEPLRAAGSAYFCSYKVRNCNLSLLCSCVDA